MVAFGNHKILAEVGPHEDCPRRQTTTLILVGSLERSRLVRKALIRSEGLLSVGADVPARKGGPGTKRPNST